MSAATMWMCTGQLGAWVPCPTSPLAITADSLGVEVRLLNGGTYVKPKQAGRRAYDIGWGGNIADLQPVKDMYDGLYGDGPFYFIDPTSIYNAMPPHWAAPQLSGGGRWPSLLGGVQPTYTATAVAGSATPPPKQAVYALPSAVPVFTSGTPRVTLPIPPTQNINLRLWGSRTGTAIIRINSYNRTTGAVSTTDVIPTTASAVATFSGATYSHIEVWITKTSTALSTITLAAMLALVGPGSTTPTTWKGGQGHNGLQFVGELAASTVRAWGEGWQSLSGAMVEVGTWLTR